MTKRLNTDWTVTIDGVLTEQRGDDFLDDAEDVLERLIDLHAVISVTVGSETSWTAVMTVPAPRGAWARELARKRVEAAVADLQLPMRVTSVRAEVAAPLPDAPDDLGRGAG